MVNRLISRGNLCFCAEHADRSHVAFASLGLEAVRADLSRLLESLPMAERARHYRQLAHEALKNAAGAAEGDLRTGYLTMAAGWHSLATEIERATAHVTKPANPCANKCD